MATTTNNLVPIKVFNEYGVEVTERISKSKTSFFTCRKRAEKYAAQIRSYLYIAFNDKKIIIGFCVPK